MGVWRSQFAFVLSINTLVILCAIGFGVLDGSPRLAFAEGGILTWFSALQLVLASGISAAILLTRTKTDKIPLLKSRGLIWGLISMGFLFLAADELFMLHENADRWLHSFFQIKETQLTDRIDDLIVALYGLIGIFALYFYRDEILRHRHALPVFLCSFLLFFVMILIDLLTNNSDVRQVLSGNSIAETLWIVLQLSEDCIKIYAEGLFLVAFYRCLVDYQQSDFLEISDGVQDIVSPITR